MLYSRVSEDGAAYADRVRPIYDEIMLLSTE